MKKRQIKKDKVVRISDENYAQIRALGENFEKKPSLNQLLALLLQTASTAIEGNRMYAVKLYTDLADARGEAIMQSVRTKQPPEMPYIVAVLGRDEL